MILKLVISMQEKMWNWAMQVPQIVNGLGKITFLQNFKEISGAIIILFLTSIVKYMYGKWIIIKFLLWFHIIKLTSAETRPVKVWANTILTESSLELSHGGLIWGHSVTSPLTLKTTHAVRFLWAFCYCTWMCLSLAIEKNKKLKKT